MVECVHDKMNEKTSKLQLKVSNCQKKTQLALATFMKVMSKCKSKWYVLDFLETHIHVISVLLGYKRSEDLLQWLLGAGLVRKYNKTYNFSWTDFRSFCE